MVGVVREKMRREGKDFMYKGALAPVWRDDKMLQIEVVVITKNQGEKRHICQMVEILT